MKTILRYGDEDQKSHVQENKNLRKTSGRHSTKERTIGPTAGQPDRSSVPEVRWDLKLAHVLVDNEKFDNLEKRLVDRASNKNFETLHKRFGSGVSASKKSLSAALTNFECGKNFKFVESAASVAAFGNSESSKFFKTNSKAFDREVL